MFQGAQKLQFYLSRDQARIQGGCFDGCSTPGYESHKKTKKKREEKKEKKRNEKKKKERKKKERKIETEKKERKWFIISSKMPSIGEELANYF